MIKMIAQVANNGRKMLGSSAEGGGEQVGDSGGDGDGDGDGDGGGDSDSDSDGGFDLLDRNSDNLVTPW